MVSLHLAVGTGNVTTRTSTQPSPSCCKGGFFEVASKVDRHVRCIRCPVTLVRHHVADAAQARDPTNSRRPADQVTYSSFVRLCSTEIVHEGAISEYILLVATVVSMQERIKMNSTKALMRSPHKHYSETICFA